MNISIKDTLLSFAIGLIIFSLLMLVICVGIFRSEISVASNPNSEQSDAQTLSLHKAVIFVVPQSDGTGLKMAVLALLDEEKNELSLSPVYGDYLMSYQTSLSYVEGVYRQVGRAMLPELFKSISGIEVADGDIIDTQSSINFAEFKEYIKSYFSDNTGEFAALFGSAVDISLIKLKDISIAVTEQITENTHQHISIINIDETVEKFKNIVR